MKAMILIASFALLALFNVATAQVDNCCFVDRQCVSDQEWIAGYWAFQNNHCAAPPQSQPAPAATSSTPFDNCCGIDRQCQTDQDWTDGYWAFQNNHCAAPAQSQPAPAATSSTPFDNCCGIDRQCQTDQDWVNGYWAYQNNQCAAAIGSQQGAPASLPAQTLVSTPLMPEGVKRLLANPSADPFNNCCFMHYNTCHSDEDWRRGHWQYHNHQCIHPAPLGTRPAITGDDPKFTKLVNDALYLIGLHAPKWLHYIDNSGAREFRSMPLGSSGGLYNQSWIIGHEWSDRVRNDPNWHPDHKYVVGYAGGITHEACHAIKQRTYTQVNGWLNEADCEEARLDVIYSIWPESPDVGWLQTSVADYHARAGISS